MIYLLGFGGTIWQILPLNINQECADVSDPAPTVSQDIVALWLLFAATQCIVSGAHGYG